MTYTVHQLAQKFGITVRSLHFYDELGLLVPSTRQENNYRSYNEEDGLRLGQILFFKELGLNLEKIKIILDNPTFDQTEALKDQYRYVQHQKQRLDDTLQTIRRVLEKKGITMTDDMNDTPTDQQMDEYAEEARQKWGHTDAWKQSQERTKHWTKADYARLAEEGKKFTQTLADAMDKNIESDEVQALIDKHYAGVNVFYDCSYAMYRNLAKMYVDDPRFAANYNKFAPGLAVFVRDAIMVYCHRHETK